MVCSEKQTSSQKFAKIFFSQNIQLNLIQFLQLFMKEQSKSVDITPRVMYDYDTHRNIPWNVLEYIPERQYLDPRKQVQDRQNEKKPKGQPDTNYVTKRGFYMDYHLKVVKALPAPCKYDTKSLFDQSKNKKQSHKHKMDSKLRKYTYIQQIEQQQKNRKKPGVGAYNLNLTEKQIQEKLKAEKNRKKKIGDKPYFYQDTEFLSTIVPGPGCVNPHLDVPHLKLNKTNHKSMIEKHTKQNQKYRKRNSLIPAPGTYTPIPLEVLTFDRIRSASGKKKKMSITTNNGFGSSARFAYQRPSKKKIVQKRPEPSTYNTFILWKGKNNQSPQKGWKRCLSAGPTRSLYQ